MSSPLPPKIPMLTAAAIVVANMVGTGVFTSLGFQVAGIPSAFPILLLWLVGGVLSFCGAVAYAELSAMMPRSGGEYHLLGQAYHPLVGFLSGWVSVTVGFGAPIAAAAMAFGSYFSSVFDLGLSKVLAAIVVVGVTMVHLRGVRVASSFQVITTSGKVVLIVVLIVCGFALAKGQNISFLPEAGDADLIFNPAFAIALFWVMYAYTGWNAAAYVAGEVENPGRNVPLALILGTGLVTLLYVALNGAFLYAAPMTAMSGEIEVAKVAADYIFGPNGGAIMGLLICFGLLSTISSMIWAGPRVTQVMGEDYRIFGFLSRKNRWGVPAWAILVQSVIVIALLIFTDFEQIIYYIQAILTLSSLLVVAAVFYLRWKRPEAERPYRAWGYPVTPALFLIMSVYMLVVFVQQKSGETLWGLLTLVVGGLVYVVSVRVNRSAS